MGGLGPLLGSLWAVLAALGASTGGPEMFGVLGVVFGRSWVLGRRS